MIQLTHLRAADYPRMPWKNGGGSTEEIARDTGDGPVSYTHLTLPTIYSV
mgnify:CR=1 FL=1